MRENPHKPKPKLTHAGGLIQTIMAKAGYNDERARVFEAWDRLIGTQIVGAAAVGLQGGKLVVEVDNSMRLHDLTLQKTHWLKRLHEFFTGRSPVSDIIFRLRDTAAPHNNEKKDKSENAPLGRKKNFRRHRQEETRDR